MEDVDGRLKALHADAGLLNRLKFFVHDLLQFQTDIAGARQHLLHDATAGATFYLSSIYFSQDEIVTLLSFENGDGVALERALQSIVAHKLQQARQGEIAGYEICASHDLAPIFQEFLDIRKGFQVEAEHKRLYKKLAAKSR